MGHGVEIAKNGAQAISSYTSGLNDLILMDGTEAEWIKWNIESLENSKGDKPRIPIIAVMANAMIWECERFIESGMDDYLRNP